MFGSIFSGRGLPQQQGFQGFQGFPFDPRRFPQQQQGMQGGLTIGQALMNRHRGM